MPIFDQRAAAAWMDFGSYENWPPYNRPPSRNLDVFLEHGSWPVLRQAKVKPADLIDMILHPNPDVGFVQENPNRFGSIPQWKADLSQRVKGLDWIPWLRDIKQWTLDLTARQKALRPLVVKWGKNWRTPGGTQAQSPDNGVIVMMPNGDRYEIQGLARLNDDPIGHWTIAIINQRAGSPVASVGHWRCDAISLVKAGADESKIPGSQGPKSKLNGLIGPRYFREFIPDFEARYVLPNVEFGPKARAVKPGWPEHPKPGQPYVDQGGVIYPEGPDPKMVPCFTGSHIMWTDARIQQWLDWLETPAVEGPAAKKVRSARYFWAINVRGWETDADEPKVPKTRIRLSESGTGVGGFESEGVCDPDTAAEFAKLGVTPAVQIGKGALRYGVIVITDGVPIAV